MQAKTNQQLKKMYVIGLTGGIGSGKSSVVEYLRGKGVSCIDADKIGHECYLPGSVTLKHVVACFGPSVLSDDGTINRKVLGAIVFSSKTEMEKLNNIMWPAIQALLTKKISKLKEDGVKIVVIEAAVMIESGWYKDKNVCNELWVVYVPKEITIKRIMERNSLSEDEARKRVDAQMSPEDKSKYGDVVLINNGEKEDLYKHVEEEWNKLLFKLKDKSEA